MNIVAANQHFAVHDHSVLHSGRLEQISTRNAIQLPKPTELSQNWPSPPANNSMPVRQAMNTAELSAQNPAQNTAQNSTGESLTESTPSTEQNEDKQRFNALQTVGAVKRILDQLSAGKLLSWIDGSSIEKIQAQVAEQRQHAAAVADSRPASTVSVTQWSYRYQELNANLSGELTLADGSAVQWSFDLAMREEQFSYRQFTESSLQDPLIVSLSGNPAELARQGTIFDFYGNGERYQLPDLGKGQFYLMRDRNQNQQLDSGLELFGPRTGQGFAELAALDDNQNSFIEKNDSQWQSLHLWSRQHGLQSLEQAGIQAISAESVATSFGLYDGEALLGRIARSGIFVGEPSLSDAYRIGLVQQVDLNI